MSRRSRPHDTGQQNKLKVLVDMDQVLCDFEGGFLTKYREKFPNEPFIPLEDRNTFYVAHQYLKFGTDYQEKAQEIWLAEGFFLNLEPLEGACDAVKEMSQMDEVEVFICTSPLTNYKYCLFEKFKWVDDHLGADLVNKMIITKDKTMVHGHLLIDDKPKIQGACLSPSWKQVVFTAPYNRGMDMKGRLRLNCWTDGQWREIIEDFKKRI